jgi:hypothetical protein
LMSSITDHDWSQHSMVESLYNMELSCPADILASYYDKGTEATVPDII